MKPGKTRRAVCGPWLLALATLIFTRLAFAAPAAGTHAPAPAPPTLNLTDTTGRSVDPWTNTTAVAHVFITASNDCPISNRYAPEVRRLHEIYAKRGVAFYLVHPNPDETPSAVARHTADYGYPCAVVLDRTQALVRQYGLTITPEVAVVDAAKSMIYRGRIDDRHVDFGRMRREPARRDLVEVLDALLAGQKPTLRTTKAIGCSIVLTTKP